MKMQRNMRLVRGRPGEAATVVAREPGHPAADVLCGALASRVNPAGDDERALFSDPTALSWWMAVSVWGAR